MSRDFLDWVKHNYCEFCGKVDDIAPNGDPVVTPAHLKTRGVGGEDEGNVIPLCLRCHSRFEDWPTEEKLKLKREADFYAKKWGELDKANV